MSTTTIPVHTTSATYTVEIGTGLLPQVGNRIDDLLHGGLATGKQRAFVITSPEIDRLHGAALDTSFPTPPSRLYLPAGEQHKRLAAVEDLAEQLAQHGADRDSVLIALGGGVIGDLTGFLAAIYMRGIRYVGVPTTLLAQVDSSLGGKTGANLVAGKNLIGAFHHPLAVYADIATLSTLPPDELRAGLQEAIKAGIIRDAALFDYLEAHAPQVLAGDGIGRQEHEDALTHVVAASVRVKAEVVSADERESGLRMILNLGHTLGHAIEAATSYSLLLHGEAVAWGMLAAITIAEHRNTITPAQAARMAQVIRMYGPLKPFHADAATLVALTAKDKKNRSGVRSYIVPVGIGNAAVLPDVTGDELLRAAQTMLAEATASGLQHA